MSKKGFVSKNNLSRAWSRLFGKVLNSKEEIEANTSENMIAGAEAVKEVYSSLKSYYDEETKTLYIQGGTSNYTYNSSTETLYIG